MRSLSCRNSSGGSCDAHVSGSPRPVLDLRLGEQVPQVDVVDVRLELLRSTGVVDEEVLQVAADERLVGADRRQQRDRREVGVQVGRVAAATRSRSFHALAMYGWSRGSLRYARNRALSYTPWARSNASRW